VKLEGLRKEIGRNGSFSRSAIGLSDYRRFILILGDRRVEIERGKKGALNTDKKGSTVGIGLGRI